MLFLIIAGLLLVSAGITGFKLRKEGAPYPKIILHIHKFLSLAAIILLVIFFVKELDFSFNTKSAEFISVLGLAALLIISMISGGLLSHKDEKNSSLENVHRISSFLSILLLVLIAVVI